MATRTITVYDRCTTVGCGCVLHSLREAESGQCSTCWVAAMSPDKKAAMNRLIASAFNGSTPAEKDEAVKNALEKFKP